LFFIFASCLIFFFMAHAIVGAAVDLIDRALNGLSSLIRECNKVHEERLHRLDKTAPAEITMTSSILLLNCAIMSEEFPDFLDKNETRHFLQHLGGEIEAAFTVMTEYHDGLRKNATHLAKYSNRLRTAIGFLNFGKQQNAVKSIKPLQYGFRASEPAKRDPEQDALETLGAFVRDIEANKIDGVDEELRSADPNI